MTEKRIGTVTHYYSKIHVASIDLEDEIRVGDHIHIQGRHDDTEFDARSIEVDHEAVKAAKAGQSIGLEVPSRVHENSDVYLVKDDTP